MNPKLIVTLATAALAVGCAGGIPEPKQPLADAESASRSARELGSSAQPEAKLHATLADEEITKAKGFISSGNNDRATSELLRARADAELAIALAREQHAALDVQSTVAQTSATLNANTAGATP